MKRGLYKTARSWDGHPFALFRMKLSHRGTGKTCRFESSASDSAFSSSLDFRIRRFWTKVVFAIPEE
jgi:hypothetical protein